MAILRPIMSSPPLHCKTHKAHTSLPCQLTPHIPANSTCTFTIQGIVQQYQSHAMLLSSPFEPFLLVSLSVVGLVAELCTRRCAAPLMTLSTYAASLGESSNAVDSSLRVSKSFDYRSISAGHAKTRQARREEVKTECCGVRATALYGASLAGPLLACLVKQRHSLQSHVEGVHFSCASLRAGLRSYRCAQTPLCFAACAAVVGSPHHTLAHSTLTRPLRNSGAGELE